MRVKPILQFGLVAGALALPGAAWPLGLGKLTVDSALGQPLSARIELLSATKEELDSLIAKVADPALYRQNNLVYQGVLARTRGRPRQESEPARGGQKRTVPRQTCWVPVRRAVKTNVSVPARLASTRRTSK